MPMKLFHGFYTENICNSDRDALYVFGDNLDRHGKGGQATIRDCANSVGFASKQSPRRDENAYFSDADGADFADEMRRFHGIVAPHLKAGGTVYWPADGIGTGLSEMPKRAPALYAKLCAYSKGLFDLRGTGPIVTAIVCGGRDFEDEKTAFESLDTIMADHKGADTRLEIIEGGAKGADRLGGQWAKSRGTLHTLVRADWDKYKKAAGFIRNSEMADRLAARRDQAGGKAIVVGMEGGVGTAMMLKIAHERGFEVLEVKADPGFKPVIAPYRTGAGKPLVETPTSRTDENQTSMDL
jgi:hypothetical protein